MDSNVLAAGIASRAGPGNALITAARAGQFDLVISRLILDETQRTLVAAFSMSPSDAAAIVRLFEDTAEMREPSQVEAVSRDPDDDPILALAVEADVMFIATYDYDLMAVGSVGHCGVVHPATAVQLVSPGQRA